MVVSNCDPLATQLLGNGPHGLALDGGTDSRESRLYLAYITHIALIAYMRVEQIRRGHGRQELNRAFRAGR